MSVGYEDQTAAYIDSESKGGGGAGKCVVPMRLAPVWCDRGSDAKSKSLFGSVQNETRTI